MFAAAYLQRGRGALSAPAQQLPELVAPSSGEELRTAETLQQPHSAFIAYHVRLGTQNIAVQRGTYASAHTLTQSQTRERG